MAYDFSTIEDDIRRYWKANPDIYKVSIDKEKEKFYVLDMFPYPSGAGLHVGHPLGYIATDILSRYKRMQGKNVLHPMGFDAFGLPAEQYAIETGQHPAKTTAENIKRYKEQLEKIGFDYDWSREVRTSDPRYYKWTQQIFLLLFNHWYNKAADRAQPITDLIAIFRKEGNASVHAATDYQGTFTAAAWQQMSEKEQQTILLYYRLAYLAYADVNWCPALGTVLANDEVKDGRSERGGHPVYRKKMRQWFLRITAYAERLHNGLDSLDWPESLKEQQRNWIGRSEGATIYFEIEGHNRQLEIFTTRPDTIFGATFMVMAPEHPLVDILTTPAQKPAVDDYLAYVKSRSDIERQQEKKVTGVFTGAACIHPFTGKRIPIYLAEYVLSGYGTGAIMAVPSDDERDQRFAEKFDIESIPVVDRSAYPNASKEEKVGTLINADFLNGLAVPEAIETVIQRLEAEGKGHRKINYRLRDANFSRQRYWGEPFPIVYKDDIPYPLPEEELPVELPEIESYKPTEEGEAPLARNRQWVELPGGRIRETDTMPGYAGSSWYFLRFMDPHNDEAFASDEALMYWQDVDFYMGGAEHAVGHLMYSRFWHKFLYDLHYVYTEEPFKKLVNQGMIQGQSAIPVKINLGCFNLDAREGVPFPKEVNIPDIFVSYDLYKKEFDCGRNDFNAHGFVQSRLMPIFKRIENEIKKIYTYLVDTNLEVEVYGITLKTRLPIKFVDGDEFNIDEYKLSNQIYSDAIFIKPPNGKFKVILEVEKMSKRWHNVVNPDDVIAEYGADTFRMYEMFLGPIDVHKPWDTQGIDGVHKFLKKYWRLFYQDDTWIVTNDTPTDQELKVLHTAIKKVNEDIERLSFNTAVSAFMVCTNDLTQLKCHKQAILEPLNRLLAPFAPHVTEHLHQQLEQPGSIHRTQYPVHNAEYLKEEDFTYPVSINGKMRTKITFPLDMDKAEMEAQVVQDEVVQKWLEGAAPKKIIIVPGRIINVVK